MMITFDSFYELNVLGGVVPKYIFDFRVQSDILYLLLLVAKHAFENFKNAVPGINCRERVLT